MVLNLEGGMLSCSSWQAGKLPAARGKKLKSLGNSAFFARAVGHCQ